MAGKCPENWEICRPFREDVLINMGTLFYLRLPHRGSWSSWLGRPLDGPSLAGAGARKGVRDACGGSLRMREVAGSNPAGPIPSQYSTISKLV